MLVDNCNLLKHPLCNNTPFQHYQLGYFGRISENIAVIALSEVVLAI